MTRDSLEDRSTSAPLDPERLLGEQIGNFRLDAILGRGGMGTVYLASHHTLARKVAIKVLGAKLVEDRELAGRFIAEARAVSEIGHPGLVQIFDFGHLPTGQLYSIMEHLEGRDLERALQEEGPMPPERVARIGAAVAMATFAAHERGIVHRDLKPANIFLAKDDAGERIVLLDFGIAKLIDDQSRGGETEANQILGTPEYIAPERARAAGPVDVRVDIYSLGCVLYALLAGRPPFRAGTPTGTLLAHIQDKPRPLSEARGDVPEALERVVMRCLQKKPAKRFATMAEVGEALGALVGDEPGGPASGRISAGPSTQIVAPARRSWSRKAWIGVGAGAALAVVGALAVTSGGAGPAGEREATAADAAPPPAPIGDNPYITGDALVIAEGAAIWRSKCADCHGASGKGDGDETPPGLHPKAFSDVSVAPGTLDRYRFEIVRRGVAEDGEYSMPAFADDLSVDETWKVVTFIATLAPEPAARSAAAPRQPAPDLDDPALIRRGEELFAQKCSSCHGETGEGDGKAASYLHRRPTDLTEGVYKLRSTPSGSLPRDSDIYRTLTAGMRMAGMPSFSGLSAESRWALVAYVKTLSDRFAEEEPEAPIQIPPRPEMNERSIEEGRAYYRMAGCARCHGDEGHGDGPEADGLEDDRGYPIHPPDFAKPRLFIGGASPEGIYRTMMTGIDGTPMWAGRDFFSPQEGWHVVHFVLSVAQTSERGG